MVPAIQKPAPSFSAEALLPGGQFGEVSLGDFKGKYVVLFFYPLDFTFVCPTEIIAFSDRVADFKALNAEVIGCSVDSKFSHLAWTNLPRKQGGLGTMQIPILADITKTIAKDYGVLIDEGADNGVALRGTFIIDPKGTLRIAHVHDLPIGRNVEEYLRIIEALEFNAKHGDVCPANWKRGGLTMKADPKGSQAYFEKNLTATGKCLGEFHRFKERFGIKSIATFNRCRDQKEAENGLRIFLLQC